MTISLDSLEKFTTQNPIGAFCVVGECMSGKNIHTGDYLIVDFTRTPTAGDVAAVGKIKGNNVYIMAKEYVAQTDSKYIATTRPASGNAEIISVDCVLGVVIECRSRCFVLS